MKRYRISVEFIASRELSDEELRVLETDMTVQLESLDDGTYEEEHGFARCVAHLAKTVVEKL